MKISAKKQLSGVVTSNENGSVNGITTLQLPCGQLITSTITMSSIEELELEVSSQAVAIIKSSSVMMGIE